MDEKVSHSRTQIIKTVFTIKNAPFTWEKYHSIKEEYADLHDAGRRKNERNMLEVENTPVRSPVLPKKWQNKKSFSKRKTIEKVNLTFSHGLVQGLLCASQPLATRSMP